MPITHAFVSAIEDGVDDTLVQPSDWNANHVGGLDNPMTTAGDIIYGGASGTPTRLAKGTEGHYLKQGATDPAWAAAPTTYYPYHIEPNIYFPKTISGSWTRSIDAALFYCGRHYSAAQNDYLEWDVLLAAGTWAISIMGQKGANRGIITVSIDGSDVGTADYYNASTTSNQIVEITGISIATTGIKALRFTGATKNASSSNYLIFLQMVVLNRTA